MTQKEFYDIMIDELRYNKGTYAYASNCLEKANNFIADYGYDKTKAVKTSLMSEGLYCPQDL